MNYYKARQIASDDSTERYHFTCRNDDRIWPVGYCAEECPGHDTPEEAAAHYHEYLLDHRLEFEDDPSTQIRCEVCDVWTTGYARLDQMRIINLCDEHKTRAVVAELTTPANQIVASW